MEVYKSFRELKVGIESKQAAFESARKQALLQDQLSSAWRWFERNISYKDDGALPLRTVHSHGKKGTYKTLAPRRTRANRGRNVADFS
jgi:hypothetical protein